MIREDIIRSVKHGLYAVNFGGGQVDITNGKFVFSASEAYLIEDGKITCADQRRHADRQRPRRPDPRLDGRQRSASSTKASAPAVKTDRPCPSASAFRRMQDRSA